MPPSHQQKGSSGREARKLLSFGDILKLTASPPTARIKYGDDPLQFAELRVPAGKGPHAVVVLIHGGCWLSQVADLKYFGPLAEALTKKGVATWNIEYHRVGDEGGGWPGTFLDVARATDHLRAIAGQYALDLDRVVAVGHSAGGHLALWLAARGRLASESTLFSPNPQKIAGVVNLAGPGDLAAFGLDASHACGEDTIRRLLGGRDGEVPDRYHDGSPSKLLPLGVPQVCISGRRDQAVPPSHGKAHAEAAKKAGDSARYIELPEAGHFELVAPGTSAWRTVAEEVLALIPRAAVDKKK